MRPKPEIVPGTRLNRLMIVQRAADVICSKGYKTRMIDVRCDCGTLKSIRAAAFFSEHLKSCGCLKVEKFIARATKHGQYETKAFRAWNDAIERCTRETIPNFARYGGRGITVCERWRCSFANFIADMGDPPSQDHSLDRIDVNGNYEPGNCRWATRTEQQRNRRNNRIIEHDGHSRTLAEWSELTGISKDAISYRLAAGWSIPLALGRPSDRQWRP